MLAQAKELAGKLRLNGIYHSLERRIEEALSAALHPADFLRMILEDEALARKNAYAQKLTRLAKFRGSCDLESWDQSRHRGISQAKLKDLSRGNFFERKENLIITGPTGVGKTHLAMALGRHLCQQGVSLAFLSVNMMFEEIQVERVAGKYVQALKKLTKPQVIILDDFGLRNYSHEEAVTLLEVLEERYNRFPVMVTSQIEPEGWNSLFQDSVISESIVDRLTQPSERIKLSGESYRKSKKSI